MPAAAPARPGSIRVALTGLVGLLVLTVAACAAPVSPHSSGSSGSSGSSAGASSRTRIIHVVAAENFWGSIASQLGGAHVQVTDIIDSPSADPHDYEPTAADGRAIATADLVLVNGIGYDAWASKLAAASPSSTRIDLTVGSLLAVPDDGNPHRWYNPDDVQKVVGQLIYDYQRLDAADATYFEHERAVFETTALAAYRAVIADIKARYAGTPIGASESIVAMVAPALGLDLVTPPSFLRAISEGTDPTAADLQTIDRQIREKQIKAYVYNSQNATPDVQQQIEAAHQAGIAVTTITETLSPATDSWEQWQTAQLDSLRAALAVATGR